MGGVAVKYGRVTSTDLTRVVKDDDLRGERRGLLGGVVLGVGGDVTTADILDRDVPASMMSIRPKCSRTDETRT